MPARATFRFYAELNDHLAPELRFRTIEKEFYVPASVKDMIAQCKLPPAADANLHLIIADLLQGAGFMRGQDPARSRHDGAARVHGACWPTRSTSTSPSWPPAAAGTK